VYVGHLPETHFLGTRIYLASKPARVTGIATKKNLGTTRLELSNK